ncbi:MAG: phosphocholine cytidylyltransferase family protein [Planctomycetes bacterium]|nr:phosphocholine cytidylyltransferase family protein [Planctomycetota bacterium]
MADAIVSTRCSGEQEFPLRWNSCGTGDGLITTALLLAAGTGSRLQPLTDDCPKCLTEVRGVPILRRLLSCLVEEGFSRLVVVVGFRDEQIRDYLESHAAGLTVDFVDCREYATTNNIYSLWRAREHIREPFVLIESDLVFDSHLLGLMRVRDRIAIAHFESPMLGSTPQVGSTVSIDEFGRVTSFRVGADQGVPGLRHKTVNLYSLSAATWREVVRRLDRRVAAGKVHDYYEVVFAEMVADRWLTLQSVRFDEGRWCEIDTLEDLRVAEQLFFDSRGACGPSTDRSETMRRRPWSLERS